MTDKAGPQRRISRQERDAMMARLREGRPTSSHVGRHARVPLSRARLNASDAGGRWEPRKEAELARWLLDTASVPVVDVGHRPGRGGQDLVVTLLGHRVPRLAGGLPDQASREWRANKMMADLAVDVLTNFVPGLNPAQPQRSPTSIIIQFREPGSASPPPSVPQAPVRPPAPPPEPPTPSRYLSHREETKSVRLLLRGAGLPVLHVGHGRGTASGWLHVTLLGKRVPRTPEGLQDTQSAEWEHNRELERRARRIISEQVAGRSTRHDDSQTDYNQSNFLVTVREPSAGGLDPSE